MAQNDPLFGVNWDLNVGKSLFSTDWIPDTETRTYTPEGSNGYKLKVSGRHKGQSYEWGYTAYYDGEDHAVYGRDDVDAIEAYRVNDKITIGFFKKGLVPAGPYARIVSEDGKSLQVQTVGHRPDGTVYFDVIEYKKP